VDEADEQQIHDDVADDLGIVILQLQQEVNEETAVRALAQHYSVLDEDDEHRQTESLPLLDLILAHDELEQAIRYLEVPSHMLEEEEDEHLFREH